MVTTEQKEVTVAGLAAIKDQAFEDERVELDGRQFERCTFTKCSLAFAATDVVSFKDCTFTRCQWSFEGAAAIALDYLVALSRDLGDPGKKLVREMLTSLLGDEGLFSHNDPPKVVEVEKFLEKPIEEDVFELPGEEFASRGEERRSR